jgi:hypothetical protein
VKEDEEDGGYHDPADSLESPDDESREESCDHKKSNIVGLVLLHSDGVETEVGSIAASDCSASVTLRENEHIVVVQQHFWDSGINRVTFVAEDKRDNRTLEFQDGRLYHEWDFFDKHPHWYEPEKLGIDRKNGKTLRSLMWSTQGAKISGVVTQAPPQGIETTHESFAVSEGPPTLAKLASEEFQRLRMRSGRLLGSCMTDTRQSCAESAKQHQTVFFNSSCRTERRILRLSSRN